MFYINPEIARLNKENRILREENEQLKARLKPEVAPGQWWVFETLAHGCSNSTIVHRLFVIRDDTIANYQCRHAVVENGVIMKLCGDTWHRLADLQRLLHRIAEPVIEGDFEAAIGVLKENRKNKQDEFMRKRSSDSVKDLAGV